jgi:uncharacterized membrane protein YjfL (UPF0719 family)
MSRRRILRAQMPVFAPWFVYAFIVQLMLFNAFTFTHSKEISKEIPTFAPVTTLRVVVIHRVN